MITSWHWNAFRIIGPVTSGFPSMRNIFFFVKQALPPMWRHCNINATARPWFCRTVIDQTISPRNTLINHGYLLLPRGHLSNRPIICANLYGRKHARVMATLPWTPWGMAFDYQVIVAGLLRVPRLYVWDPRKLPLLANSRIWRGAGFPNCRFDIFLY